MGRARKPGRWPLKPDAPDVSAEALDLGDLLRHSSVPVFLVNSRRRLIFINEACTQACGVSAAEGVGQECRYAETGKDTPTARLAALCPPPDALAGQVTVAEALLVDRTGQRRWWKISCWPIAAADGSFAAVLGRIDPSESDGAVRPSEPLRLQLARQREDVRRRFGFDSLVAVCPAMLRVLEQAKLARQTLAPVCLIGAAGTGKERLARAMHAQSALRDRPLTFMDAAKLSAPDAERVFAEINLEGRRSEPVAPAAVYLHEPARLARDQQLRLIAANVWLLAGTTGDPAKHHGDGLLTSELYHRLTTLVIPLPSLSERGDDIPLLAQQILEHCNGSAEHQVAGLTPAALGLLAHHRWPGNLDEFTAVLADAHARCRQTELDVVDFAPAVRTAAGLAQMPDPRPERSLPLDSLLENAERRIIQLALKQARGNLSRAAGVLQVSRPRLHRRMGQLGLLEDRIVLADESSTDTDEASRGA